MRNERRVGAYFGRDSRDMQEIIQHLGGYWPYALALVAVWGVLGFGRSLRERAMRRLHLRLAAGGAVEPDSLHPVIDPARCVGCGACTNACPEGKILGMIDGKAKLLDPASCIGHGACKTVCPVGAIELVFGSARRGVDIPIVSPGFESTVPGLFIAGELGGMGLIANAIEQGRQAIDSVAKLDGLGDPNRFDVVIVGAGPAGIAASLAAKQHKLSFLTLEQSTLGGTVAHYPRGKLVMTRPARLPLYGKFKLRRVRKERLLSLWDAVLRKTNLEIRQGVRVERIVPRAYGFDVSTNAGPCRTRAVLLATGRRGSPRRLGVPGEQASKVVYSLDDAAQYRGRHVLVVGGGDTAVETAVEVARHSAASVTLCYRGQALTRPRRDTLARLEPMVKSRRVALLLSSQVSSIAADRVVIDAPGRQMSLQNDAVIVCIGSELPTSFLSDIGVEVATKYGTA